MFSIIFIFAYIIEAMGYLNSRHIQSNEKQTQYLTNFEITVVQRHSGEMVKWCIAVWCSGIAVKWFFTATPFHHYTAIPLHRYTIRQYTTSLLHRYTISPPYRCEFCICGKSGFVSCQLNLLQIRIPRHMLKR